MWDWVLDFDWVDAVGVAVVVLVLYAGWKALWMWDD